MHGVFSGPVRVMSRMEYLDIHSQLQRIQAAGGRVLVSPTFLADEGVTWERLCALMVEHSVPPVIASDGAVTQVAGVPCVSTVTQFLDLVGRKLFSSTQLGAYDRS